jgi:hypothetical protein
MARAVGHAPSTIHRIWAAFGLQPHRAESFKLSSDALFVEKVRDIVGRSTQELETAIRSYIEAVNADPKPFRWTKSADDILRTVQRFCRATLQIAECQSQIAQTSESGH